MGSSRESSKHTLERFGSYGIDLKYKDHEYLDMSFYAEEDDSFDDDIEDCDDIGESPRT